MLQIDEQLLNEFESKRKNIVKKVYIAELCIALVAVIIFFVAGVNSEMIPFYLIGTIIIMAIFSSIFIGNYKSNFKYNIIKPIIEKTYSNLIYTPKSGVSKSEVLFTGIENTEDVFRSEDLIEGMINGINIKVSDLHIQRKEVHYNGKTTTTTYVTTFRGKWIILEFNKSFTGLIQVLEASKFGRKFRDMMSSRMSLVEFESVEFNKKFATYTSDEHNAFYVITPQIQEELLKLEAMNAGTIKYGFKDGLVHIGINDGSNSLESNVFRQINRESISRLLSGVTTIEKYVEILRLNAKIFK